MNKISRVDLYLQSALKTSYINTDEEQALLNKFVELYTLAKEAHDNNEFAKPANIKKWRKAYYGTLNALKADGSEESERKSRQLRKMVYELVESKVDNSVPMPKMQPRYKMDLPVVDITENYLKFEMDRILTKYNNDKSERCTYVDGTSWYKVCWNSFDSSYDRSGDIKVELYTVDQIIPQPGVNDYRDLEYIFERKRVSVTKIYDLYGRLVAPSEGNMVDIISCYYLNENHIVGLFMWTEQSHQVICNEKDWQIRKIRKCKNCNATNPIGEECRICGNKKFKYDVAEKEILEHDLQEIYNPYDAGETDDTTKKDMYASRVFATAGTEIPYYRITQLPFVPRPAVSAMDSIYGVSEVFVTLDMQDMINKLLTKAADKTIKSGAVLTKPEKMKLSDKDDTFKVLGVRSAEEAQMVQLKQLQADTTQDITMASLLYDSAKSSSGVTDSFQGKRDTTATSGKAKQYAAAQSAGRIESLRVMKAAAFSGVYELILKYLLAFSDEKRKFVKILPNGNKQEMTWSKYLFLEKDANGNFYYNDDFTFSSDPASTLSQNRVQMWQETQDKFIQGAMGNPADTRTLKLFWNMMEQFQYPLAKTVIAGIEDMEQHLPPEIEQAIMSNPEIMAMISQMLQGTGQGGARPNSGPAGNGATHTANVERTNERNRATNRSNAISAQQGGGV